MKKYLLSSFGNVENHFEIKSYLKNYFEDINLFCEVGKKKINKKKINILLEGVSDLRKKSYVENIYNNKSYKIGILLTEMFVGSSYLNANYYTYDNNYLSKRNIYKKKIFFHLIFIHLLWRIKKELKFLSKLFFRNTRLYNYILKFIGDINSTNHLIESKLHFYFSLSIWWKNQWINFYKYFQKANFVINLGTETKFMRNYFKKKKIKYHLIHLVYLKNLNNKLRVKKYLNEDKKIDLLFTGRLTEYRLGILQKIKNSGLKVVGMKPIKNIQTRKKFLSKTKFLLELPQQENQPFFSGMRSIFSFNVDVPIIILTNKKSEPFYLKKFLFCCDEKNLINFCLKATFDYKNYYYKFKKNKMKFISFSKNKKKLFKNFLLKNSN